MNAHVDLGEARTYRLTKALLVYEGENHMGDNSGGTAVSVHEVRDRQLGPGQPITRAAVESLAQALGRNLAAGWLPPQIVSLGFGKMAWFCPAGRRRIWFKADGRFNGGAETEHKDTPKVTKLNGKFAQHPPLLFVASDHRLAVFALTRNERPQANTVLHRAPYWNLWESGEMCAGNRAMPAAPMPSAIAQYEAAFFDSAFSHTNITKLCTHPGGHTGLWQELTRVKRAPDSKYWTKNLCRLSSTVTSILTKAA